MKLKKFLIPLIIIALVVLNIFLYINHQSIYRKYMALEEKNENLQRDNKELSQRLSETEGERKRLLERIEVIQRDLDKVSFEREEYRKKFEILSVEHQELIENLKLVKEENNLLKQRLKQIEDERIKLEETLKDVENERNALNKRLAELEKRLEEKKEVEEKAKVELPPIVVRPTELASSEASPLSGKIIVVNKEYNFVIVDLGEEQGIKVGRSFDVFRDQNLIGKLEVIETRPTVSACDIKSKSVDFVVGDIVR